MLLPTRTRRAILAAGVALAPRSRRPPRSPPSRALPLLRPAARPTTSAAEPIIAPVAAALIPGPIDIDRKAVERRDRPPRLQAG